MSAENQPKDNYHLKLRIKSGILFVVCLILTFICIVPIYMLIVNATLDGTTIASGTHFWFGTNMMENAKNTEKYNNFDALLGFKNSAIITIGATILSVFFSSLTAYGLYVYDFKLRGAAYTFILAVMMVPAQVTSIGFLKFMYTLGLVNTFTPLILPAIAAPAIVFFMRQYLQSTLSMSLIEAARIDGCGEFRTFLQIALPLMKPAIAVQSIFAFIANWNNFYMPSMIMISDNKKATMPMMINNLISDAQNAEYGSFYFALALSIVPIIVIYVLLSKFIIAGVALGGVKE